MSHEAVIAVAVATMWTAPEAVRPLDAIAVADGPDVGAWVDGMTGAELLDLDGRTLTQLLLGERVLVESVADGWARVIAVEQPAASLDARGYPGYVRLAHLAEPPADAERVIVAVLATALRDRPGGDVIMPGVVIGTRLPVAGDAEHGWLPVALPGGVAWVPAAEVAPAPAGPPAGDDVLAVASLFIDVPYVWGGMSAYGIDCSGLVHLTYRRLGVRVPRDADDQARASDPLPPGAERPGDLYFFARDGKPVHHVGFVAGTGRSMLHASGQSAAGRVVRETMTPDRAAGLSGTHRVPR